MRIRNVYFFGSLAAVLGGGMYLRSATPEVRSGSWAPSGAMTQARTGAAAVRMPDGRVLVTGGTGVNGALASAELFGSTGSFTQVAPMIHSRSQHVAVALEDGRVLVAGGKTQGDSVFSSAEVYDPNTNVWADAGLMNASRIGHTATLLPGGRVLIAGGQASVIQASLEIFDPSSNQFEALTAQLSSPRTRHGASLLPDGRVLLAGGFSGAETLRATDIFDPRDGTVSPGPDLLDPREDFSATSLLDGRVLFAGGSAGSANLASAEIFDPATSKFSTAGAMTTARHGHLAFLLPNNNRVLLVGGDAAGSSAELFTPWRGSFQPTGSLQENHSEAAGAPLGLDGALVLAGGRNRSLHLDSSSLYRFATIRTDQELYFADDTVNITGSGWQPGEKVTLRIQESPKAHEDRTLIAAADASGNISSQLPQDGRNPETKYILNAAGSASEAQLRFASSAANLDQCSNGALAIAPNPQTNTNCATSGDWVNGNLGTSKAHYLEGNSVPYRLRITGLPAGSANNTVTIQWDTTKTGMHALDYITTYNATQNANPCAGFSSCGTPSTFPITTDSNLTAAMKASLGASTGNFTIYNGTISAVSAFTVSGSYGADSSTAVTVTFHLNAGQTGAVLAWGGHIATRIDWGIGNSSVSITGSPFHTRLLDLNGSGGNQDRSLSNDAVVFPASITITKVANINGSPITSQAFGFTSSTAIGPLASTFSLCGSVACSATAGGITDFTGSYTINETPIPSGWTFDNLVCTVSGGTSSSPPNPSVSTVIITVKEGDNVVCTYTNHRLGSTLNVIKHVINDNGGAKVASDFTMTVTGGSNPSPAPFLGSESGTVVAVDPGVSYTVTESGPSGYSSSSSALCIGSVAAGAQNTCTFTNNDQQGTLIVNKVVVNNNGGTKSATDFSFVMSGGNATNAVVAFKQGSDTLHGTNTLSMDAGTYTITETGVTGYTPSYANCSNVMLTNGGTQTCTITNTDQSATLIVKKHVINDNGGTLAASNFTMNVTGTNVLPAASFSGNEAGTTVTLKAGSYGVDETSVAGYKKTLGTDCSGTIANGETKTCTITNDDQAATLTVIKHVVNNNGGGLAASAFTMNVTGTNVLPSASFSGSESGTPVTLNAGSYSVDETAVSGYTKTIGAGCSGTIANGGTATCTITNDDNPTSVTFVKVCAPTTDTMTQFTVNLTPNPTGSAASVGILCGQTKTTTDVIAGTYTVGESPLAGWNGTLPAGWATPAMFAGDCVGGNLTLAIGDQKTCYILNVNAACTPTFPPQIGTSSVKLNGEGAAPRPRVVGKPGRTRNKN